MSTAKTQNETLVAEITELLQSGKEWQEIIDRTGATRYLIWRVAQKVGAKPKHRSTGLTPSTKNPTTHTGYQSCQCVRCRAEKLRTPAFLRALHAADEAAKFDKNHFREE